jgi:hypothetical protein
MIPASSMSDETRQLHPRCRHIHPPTPKQIQDPQCAEGPEDQRSWHPTLF